MKFNVIPRSTVGCHFQFYFFHQINSEQVRICRFEYNGTFAWCIWSQAMSSLCHLCCARLMVYIVIIVKLPQCDAMMALWSREWMQCLDLNLSRVFISILFLASILLLGIHCADLIFFYLFMKEYLLVKICYLLHERILQTLFIFLSFDGPVDSKLLSYNERNS